MQCYNTEKALCYNIAHVVALQFWGVIFVACKLFQPKMLYNSGDIIILFDEEMLHISQNTTGNCIIIWFLYGFTRVLGTNLKNTYETKGQSQKHSKPFFPPFCLHYITLLSHCLFIFSILYEKLTDCLTTLPDVAHVENDTNQFMHKIYVPRYQTINHAGNKLSKAL